MNDTTHIKDKETLGADVLNRIERDQVTPKARILFVLRNVVFWALWALVIFLGAIAVSVAIFTELNVGWEIYEMTHKNALTFFAETLPYAWLTLFALMVFFGVYNLRHTKRGYRYSLTAIIVLSILGSIGGGVTLHALSVSSYIDSLAAGRVPLHTPMSHVRARAWTTPERGLYAGTLETINTELGTISLRTPNGEAVTFSFATLSPEFIAGLTTNSNIRIVATSTANQDKLIACYIMPWARMHMQNPREFGERRKQFFENFEHRMQGMMHSLDEDEYDPCTPVLESLILKSESSR